MLSLLTVKVPEAMLAEIETLVDEVGLWENRSAFVRDAIEEHIRKYWEGERFEY